MDAALTRSPFWLDSMRANTASVIPVNGTPSSRADSLVHRPVPFCSALSSIAFTSAADVGAPRNPLDLGRDRRQHLGDPCVGFARATRHDARSQQRALLPT